MEKGTLFQFRGSQTQYQNHDRDSSDDQETADLFFISKTNDNNKLSLDFEVRHLP